MSLNAYEQYFLELTNRARLDPNSEAARFGISLNQDLSPGQISSDSKQVLAANDLLERSSEAHSNWMLDADVFSHTGENGSDPGERMRDAGYTFNGNWTWGENLAWAGTTGPLDRADMIDKHHEGLFLSEGHRLNTMKGDFREVGVAAIVGNFTQNGTTFNSSMLTANFAKSGSDVFVTGVAYNDKDGDSFYSIGEGRGGIRFDVVGHSSDTTAGAGGWAGSVDEDAGWTRVAISHDGTKSNMNVNVEGENIKLDLMSKTKVATDSDINLVSGPVKNVLFLGDEDILARGNGANNVFEGNRGDNTFYGQGGNDVLYGNAGNDKLMGNAGNDKLYGGSGHDTLWGGDGNDTMVGANGNDTLGTGKGHDTAWGGGGNDRIWGGGGDDMIGAGSGNDRAWGGVGNDTLWGGNGNDVLGGGAGVDKVWGGSGRDTIWGGSQNDTLGGGNGNDKLYGGSGNDRLWGGNNNDRLEGGAGNDVMTGGNGADTFVFKANESGDNVITDFSRSEGDVLRLDADLWDGNLNVGQVVNRYATTQNGDTTFDFGDVSFTLDNVISSNLEQAIDIF